MKKKEYIFFILFLFFKTSIFSETYLEQRKVDEVVNKMDDFFSKVAPSDLTVEKLIEIYGEPDSISNRKTGYLEDKVITYNYDRIGEFNFFVKTDDNKVYYSGYVLNSYYIETINFPTTMDGVDNFFNYKFKREEFKHRPGRISFIFANYNFIFNKEDGKLFLITWSPRLD